MRPQLLDFAERMLADALPRKDQRAKGELYLRGLLTDGQRKSMQPMAQRLGVDHQGLQQFVTSSTWDYETVRANVARWGVDVDRPGRLRHRRHGLPEGWQGLAVGGAACTRARWARPANCQIGVSVQLVTDAASLAANWRLYCPASWDDTTVDDPDQAEQIRARRARAGVPDEVRHREKWRLALDMLDQMNNDWALPKPPVGADAGYGDTTEFRLGLEERGYQYVVAGRRRPPAPTPTMRQPALIAATGRGRPPKPRYRDAPTNLHDLALAAGRDAGVEVTWRHGTRKTKDNPTAAMTLTVPRLQGPPRQPRHPPQPRRHPAHPMAARRMARRHRRTHRLLAVQHGRSTRRWPNSVRLAKIRWRIEHDYRELKTGLGLDHFEGRSFIGWHRHVTLTVLAQAFCTMLRLDPKAPAPA